MAQTLAEEHAQLRREVEVRRRRVTDALGAGRWPAAETRALVDYLRYELLDQAVYEERFLYPLTAAGFSPERMRPLVEDHIRLRDVADELSAAATAPAQEQDPAALVELLDELQIGLDRHLHNEQEALAPPEDPIAEDPMAEDLGVARLRRPFRSHDWFPLTEGPVVELDRLPHQFVGDALLDRLARMRPGERLDLRSGRSLRDLEELLARRGMLAEFGWAYLQEGPDCWRARITRRPGRS